MKILGIGNDIVKINRIERLYEKYGDKFLRRILSSQEKRLFLSKKNKMQYLASRWSLKESIWKAINPKKPDILLFSDINITTEKDSSKIFFFFLKIFFFFFF